MLKKSVGHRLRLGNQKREAPEKKNILSNKKKTNIVSQKNTALANKFDIRKWQEGAE